MALAGAAGCSDQPAAQGKTTEGASADAVSRTVDRIKESSTVKIGVFFDKAPFGSQDENGQFVGHDVVYGTRIAEDLGVEVALGVASPDDPLITDLDQLTGQEVIVVKGTTAEAYLEKNTHDLELIKFEQYAEGTSALLDGRGAAWVTDNTEALAWTIQNPGFSTGITSLGPADTIAGAVSKGNTSLLEWLDSELVDLGEEQFFHKDYEETLKPVYGDAVSPD
jgi:polar amino acid transport system substrate-binding protein